MGDFERYISPVEEIIEEARAGRFVVIADDENRENEGDLILPADHVTADAINFMARYGRGLICMPIEPSIAARLELEPMVSKNTSKFGTNFTVSVGARHGVTTGISAYDRAKTVQVVADPQSTPDDISTPGHIFPLIAKEGGVLERNGHTEAALDIARLSGARGAAVLCEVMNDDGTMARMPDLIEYAAHHGLKIGTISDLVAYLKKMPVDNAVGEAAE